MVGNIPGITFLLGATVLLVLASITVPVIHRFYFLESNFASTSISGFSGGSVKLTLGMWGYCVNPSIGDTYCSKSSLGYGLDLDFLNLTEDGRITRALIKGLTKAQILHPIAAGISFIAFIFALSTHLLVDVLASLISFFAFIVTAVAFGIDCGLYITAKHRINKIDDGSTSLSNAFWMVLAAVVLNLLASFLVCLGGFKRRKNKNRGASTPAPVMAERRWPWQRRY